MRLRSARKNGRQVECPYRVAGKASALGAGRDIPKSAYCHLADVLSPISGGALDDGAGEAGGEGGAAAAAAQAEPARRGVHPPVQG